MVHTLEALVGFGQELKRSCKKVCTITVRTSILSIISTWTHKIQKCNDRTDHCLTVYIHLNYPTEPEEIDLQEATLWSEWDPTNHIENLFQSVKEGALETLYQMDAVASTDISKTCVKYDYSAIRGSGQFESACIKWKALPAADRATMGQIKTFFAKKYDVYDAYKPIHYIVPV
jgi:hypothetical protein